MRLCFLFVMTLIMFHFETSYGADSERPWPTFDSTETTQKPEPKQKSSETYSKTIKSLDQKLDSKKYLKQLGPGVTGGGHICQQKIAASFDFLETLLKQNKLGLGELNQRMLAAIHKTTISFGTDLKTDAGDKVDALNIPKNYKILIDRKLCDNSFEPIMYYTPLLLHEMFRIVHVDDTDSKLSKKYVTLIRNEMSKKINLGRRFRIVGTPSGRFAIAWGLKDQIVDFETLDQLSPTETKKFCEKFNDTKVENYLVDLTRNKIIDVIRDSQHGPVAVSFGRNSEDDPCNDERNDFILTESGPIKIFNSFDNEDHRFYVEKIFALDDDFQVEGVCSDLDCDHMILKSIMPVLPQHLRFDVNDMTAWDLQIEKAGSFPEEARKWADALPSGKISLWTATLRIQSSESSGRDLAYDVDLLTSFEKGAFAFRPVNLRPHKD